MKESQLRPHRPGIYEKVFFFLSGAIISVPFPALVNSMASAFLILSLPIPLASFISLSIIAPVLEEFAKAYPLFYRHGETRRSIISLGFLSGLGFGVSEFLLYTLILSAPVVIRLPLIFFHAANTMIVAYGISRGRSLVFYLIAVFFHAFYNFSVYTNQGLNLFSLITVFASFSLALVSYRRSKEVPIAF